MSISLRDLGKPFLTWRTYIYKQKRIRNNHNTKNHIQELLDKKNVNTKSMIIGISPMKKRKLKKKKIIITIIMLIIRGK